MVSYKKILPPQLIELQELRQSGFFRLILEAVTTGLAAGLVIGFSRIAYTWINHRLAVQFQLSELSALKMILAAAFIAFCVFTAWFCVRRQPLVGGSGIPQVELALSGKLPMPWRSVLVYKFIGTLATMSGCLSLGRAAPSVQMGSAIGCGVGHLWHEDGLRPRFLVGGAAAGLTACFGAPWAGMLFAFEELRALPDPALLIFMALTTASAWFMTDIVLNLGLVFPIEDSPFSLQALCMAVPAGLLCAVLCWIYNASIARLTMAADRVMGLKTRYCLAFGLGFVLLFAYPRVIDGLAPTLFELSAGGQALSFLLTLWLIKMAFNIISGSSLAPGGLLLPLLTAGGFTGSLLTAMLAPLPLEISSPYLIPLCMAGFFAGIVRAPLTAALVVVETTGCWTLLPPLVLVSFITAVTANRLGSQPIFTFWRMRQLRTMRQARRTTLSSR